MVSWCSGNPCSFIPICPPQYQKFRIADKVYGYWMRICVDLGVDVGAGVGKVVDRALGTRLWLRGATACTVGLFLLSVCYGAHQSMCRDQFFRHKAGRDLLAAHSLFLPNLDCYIRPGSLFPIRDSWRLAMISSWGLFGHLSIDSFHACMLASSSGNW